MPGSLGTTDQGNDSHWGEFPTQVIRDVHSQSEWIHPGFLESVKANAEPSAHSFPQNGLVYQVFCEVRSASYPPPSTGTHACTRAYRHTHTHTHMHGPKHVLHILSGSPCVPSFPLLLFSRQVVSPDSYLNGEVFDGTAWTHSQ